MMARFVPSRKAKLRAALALAGKNVDGFCTDMGVTKNHLYTVLRGERESLRLTAAIDAFIAQHLPRQTVAA